MDNKNITLVKYQGTRTFVAGLFYKEEEDKKKKYYFGFTPTRNPLISITDNEEELFTSRGLPIIRLGERQINFSVEGIPIGKRQKIFCLISINPEEFDSMYKLLECIYDD